MVNKGVVMKETEKFSVEAYLKSIELAEVRAELKAKLETAMLMSKLMRMSKE
jgi:hypothetical protein